MSEVLLFLLGFGLSMLMAFAMIRFWDWFLERRAEIR